MPSPNAVFTEIVSTTFRNHRKKFADNISNHNALLRHITKRGNKDLLDGGLTL